MLRTLSATSTDDAGSATSPLALGQFDDGLFSDLPATAMAVDIPSGDHLLAYEQCHSPLEERDHSQNNLLNSLSAASSTDSFGGYGGNGGNGHFKVHNGHLSGNGHNSHFGSNGHNGYSNGHSESYGSLTTTTSATHFGSNDQNNYSGFTTTTTNRVRLRSASLDDTLASTVSAATAPTASDSATSPTATANRRNTKEPRRDQFATEKAYQRAWLEWRKIRDSNNSSVKKSREKARERAEFTAVQAEEMRERISQLQQQLYLAQSLAVKAYNHHAQSLETRIMLDDQEQDLILQWQLMQ